MTEPKITFIENHNDSLDKVFPEGIPEDIDVCNSNWHYDLEELNPSDAIEVAAFDSEVDGFAITWIGKCYYYVCIVPDEVDTYLLFNIDWDDNWETWTRDSLCAASGVASHHAASKVLLNKFAQESLEGEGEGKWRKFLEGFIIND